MGKTNKGSTAAAASTETTGSAVANGGLIFQKMPSDYVIPQRTHGGQWDAVVEQLCAKENKGATVRLFKTTKDQVQLTYTRAKALKNAAKRLGKDITVAVRLEGDVSVLLAQGN